MFSAAVLAIFLLAQIAGGEFTYTVMPGDSLTSIGARFGVDVPLIAEANELKPSSLLTIGQTLRIDNRHIVPERGSAAIVINIPQRVLFFYQGEQLVRHYPVAVGSAGWKTPLGTFSIGVKEEDPTWDVPASIQEEMRREGKAVITRVPPGLSNPLGKYWIGLSVPGIGIHGTNAPSSVYKLATHGCIRLHPEDIEDLVGRVAIEDGVRIIYEPVLLAAVDDSIFLEVHRDAYRHSVAPLDKARELARGLGIEERIDWKAVDSVIRKREGIARDVTARGPLPVHTFVSSRNSPSTFDPLDALRQTRHCAIHADIVRPHL